MTTPFFQKRFVILAGKGGVGKSTMAAALGLAAARRGLRTLIAELNTTEKIPSFFGLPAGGHAIRQVAHNLYTINIQPEPALREYGLMKLRYRAAYRVVFENEFMRRLLRMLPGMNELLLIGKAWYEEDRKDERGLPFWDMVIVDAPATGHGVSLFRLPHVILSVVSTGPLADDTRRIRDLLLDPHRTCFNVVTLPEEMPFAETLSLMDQNRSVLRMPPGFLLINQVWPPQLSDRESAAVLALKERQGGNSGLVLKLLECARYMQERRGMQDEYIGRLHTEIGWPAIDIPHLFTEKFEADAIGTIADLLDAHICEHEGFADDGLVW